MLIMLCIKMDIYESINPDFKFLILLPHLKKLCQNLTMFIQTVSKKGLFLFISLKYIRAHFLAQLVFIYDSLYTKEEYKSIELVIG